METEILGDHQEYLEEKFEEVLVRYNRFGKDIYNVIKRELPNVFKYLKYYKATKSTENMFLVLKLKIVMQFIMTEIFYSQFN
ncbi:hypothetical protein EV143_101393 [Flavobacterium chryseum]|uniref:hypothetical protein n=1 Tax=Flavobacterium sp. P3160 TaxID=2512113 RepID=UPI00105D095D|nr:hypothetical protein [Flavobacterium sp. P3160]TDO83950.1 hypothetical protein EV143_101393 [Flavobacterium sp. P3160]